MSIRAEDESERWRATAGYLAAEGADAERAQAERVAAEYVAAEHVAAERVAAEYVAAEYVAAEYVAAEYVAAEYVARADRLAPLFPRARPLPAALPRYPPHNLALELQHSILYENADSVDAKLRSLTSRDDDSLWNGKPQQYFESMNYGRHPPSDDDAEPEEYDSDSLAP